MVLGLNPVGLTEIAVGALADSVVLAKVWVPAESVESVPYVKDVVVE